MLGLGWRAFYPAGSWAENKTRAAFSERVTANRLPDTEEDRRSDAQQPLLEERRARDRGQAGHIHTHTHSFRVDL